MDRGHLETLIVVGAFVSFDRLQGLVLLDRIDWLGLLDRLDRELPLGLFASLGRFPLSCPVRRLAVLGPFGRVPVFCPVRRLAVLGPFGRVGFRSFLSRIGGFGQAATLGRDQGLGQTPARQSRPLPSQVWPKG